MEKSPHAAREWCVEFGKVCARLAFYCIKAKSLANQVQEIEVKLESFGRMASGKRAAEPNKSGCEMPGAKWLIS